MECFISKNKTIESIGKQFSVQFNFVANEAEFQAVVMNNRSAGINRIGIVYDMTGTSIDVMSQDIQKAVMTTFKGWLTGMGVKGSVTHVFAFGNLECIMLIISTK